MSKNGLRKQAFEHAKQTSGAEARTYFQQLGGTTEVVPFPKPSQSDFTRKL